MNDIDIGDDSDVDKEHLQELFANHIIESPKIGNVVIEEVEKCDGEARANNRKGKLIFFYEWEITLKWKGENMIIKMVA